MVLPSLVLFLFSPIDLPRPCLAPSRPPLNIRILATPRPTSRCVDQLVRSETEREFDSAVLDTKCLSTAQDDRRPHKTLLKPSESAVPNTLRHHLVFSAQTLKTDSRASHSLAPTLSSPRSSRQVRRLRTVKGPLSAQHSSSTVPTHLCCPHSKRKTFKDHRMQPRRRKLRIECMMRDCNMADGDVTSPGVWEPESDAALRKLIERKDK